jgi:hypothetical protein
LRWFCNWFTEKCVVAHQSDQQRRHLALATLGCRPNVVNSVFMCHVLQVKHLLHGVSCAHSVLITLRREAPVRRRNSIWKYSDLPWWWKSTKQSSDKSVHNRIWLEDKCCSRVWSMCDHWQCPPASGRVELCTWYSQSSKVNKSTHNV